MRRYSLLFTFLFSLPFCSVIGQKAELSQFELGITGIPLYDFSEGYAVFVANVAARHRIGKKLQISTNLFIGNDRSSIAGIDSRSLMVGILPSLRYSFFSGNRIRIFAEVGAGIGLVRYKARGDEDIQQLDVSRYNNGFKVFTVGLGAGYQLSDKVGLEFSIPYIIGDNINDQFFSPEIFSGLGVLIGVQFYLK